MPNKKGRVYVPAYETAGYMDKFLVPGALDRYVALAVDALQNWTDDYDAIAFRGMSGALIAPPVAAVTGKSLIMVRKPGEITHSSLKVEGDKNARKYIILDDFVSTGRTACRIVEAVKEFAPKAKCLGALDVHYLRHESISELGKKKYQLNTEWQKECDRLL